MFFSYRTVNVWSAPECLKQQKKRQDPTAQMDVYSFGMLMWEILYEAVPFEGELKDAVEYVVKEDARPKIVTLDQSNVHESGITDQVRESIDVGARDEVL